MPIGGLSYPCTPHLRSTPRIKKKSHWWTIKRWLHKKHPDTKMDKLAAQYGWHKPRQKALRWRDRGTVPVPLAAIRVVRYWQGTDPGPHYASTSRESPVRNERRTPGSVRGIRKPSGRNP